MAEPLEDVALRPLPAGRSGFGAAGGHLEEPDWSRAVLGLTADLEGRRPVLLRLGPDRIDLDFAGPVRPPGRPFESNMSAGWMLPRRVALLHSPSSTPRLPEGSRTAALVTAWNRPFERGLVDLVAAGSVALEGPPVAVGTTLSDVVVELATRRWCDLDELVLVGFGAERPVVGAQYLHELSDATSYLASPQDGERGRCVVLAPPFGERRRDTDDLAVLLGLVHARASTGLICCNPAVSLFRVRWQLLSHRETEAVFLRSDDGWRCIVASSEDDVDDRLLGEPLPVTRAFGNLKARERAPRSTTGGVFVRILGPVSVDGSVEDLRNRPRAREILAYLVSHPAGCSGDALASAIWPQRRVPVQTVANRLSELRRALGEANDGTSRLRRVGARHRLSGEVATDWSRFSDLTAAGSTMSDWAEALSLVRGRPFSDLGSDWPLLEGISQEIESAVIDTASRLASVRLGVGDLQGADWALRRGILVSPWDERLYRLLMLVRHESGSRAGVELALRNLARALELEGDPLEGVHPKTAELYLRLLAAKA